MRSRLHIDGIPYPCSMFRNQSDTSRSMSQADGDSQEDVRLVPNGEEKPRTPLGSVGISSRSSSPRALTPSGGSTLASQSNHVDRSPRRSQLIDDGHGSPHAMSQQRAQQQLNGSAGLWSFRVFAIGLLVVSGIALFGMSSSMSMDKTVDENEVDAITGIPSSSWTALGGSLSAHSKNEVPTLHDSVKKDEFDNTNIKKADNEVDEKESSNDGNGDRGGHSGPIGNSELHHDEKKNNDNYYSSDENTRARKSGKEHHVDHDKSNSEIGDLAEHGSAQIDAKDAPGVSRIRYGPKKIAKCKAGLRHGFSVREDPCLKTGFSKKCGCGSKFTYQIPEAPDSSKALTATDFRENVVYSYVHVNKAGGQTMKSILMDAIEIGEWSAAGIGTFPGWQAVFKPDDEDRKAAPVYVCGGLHSREVLPDPTQIGECPTRAVWGSLSMGLCELFPDRPCIYFTTVRDPIKRAISEYNYFCVLGEEGRKKWLPEWKRDGECPVNIYEYFMMGRTPANFLKLRLTRGCDEKCGIDVAKANLAHPCLRYIVLEDFKNDIKRFADQVPGALSKALQKAYDEETHMNKSELHPRVDEQIQDKELMAKLASLFEDDIVIYNYALSIRNKKWSTPIQACPAPP